MNDRELLEMAAKAAGIKAQFSDNYGDFSIGEPYSRGEIRWNPLTDDGDSLRLAVKLQLTICNEHISEGVSYCVASGYGIDSESPSFPEVDSGENEPEIIPDDYAATRRAIVMAAAQLGRSMP